MKAIMMRVVLLTSLISSQMALSGEALDGKEIAELLVGNTLKMDYRGAGKDFDRRTFLEYYAEDGSIYGMVRKKEYRGNFDHFVGSWEVKDGKFCTSVYGRRYSCDRVERINEDTFNVVGESGTVRNVKLYEGKYHELN